jgi:hypothetical protein
METNMPFDKLGQFNFDSAKAKQEKSSWQFKSPTVEVPLVPVWAFTPLKNFESCPLMLQNKKTKAPITKEVDLTALNRGRVVHKEAEEYIRGDIPKITDKKLKKRQRLFDEMREKHSEGLCITEEQIGFDINWNPTDYWGRAGPTPLWGRSVIDLTEYFDNDRTDCVLRDWKTGKGSDYAKFGYADQMIQYVAVKFAVTPSLKFAETRLVFVDTDKPDMVQRYTREQAEVFIPRITERALRLTTCTEFEPKPTKSACKFCDWNDSCPYAYQP